MSTESQRVTGYLMPYPGGVMRALLRLPLLFYRLGLGDLANLVHIMVLTTRGRRTGAPRHTPIEYRRHGSKLYLISAWGERPNWYQNLLAAPVVTVQQGRKKFAARAQVVDSPGEALRALQLFRRVAPFVYDPLLARLGDEPELDVKKLPDVSARFTIVRLDAVSSQPSLPPLRADLMWVLPVGLLAGAATMALVWFTRPRRS